NVAAAERVERDREARGCLLVGRARGVGLDVVATDALGLRVLGVRRRRPVGVDDVTGGIGVTVDVLVLGARERGERDPRDCGQGEGGVAGAHEASGYDDNVMALCRRSASIWGGRPRKATNDSSAGRLPPLASTSSRKRDPVAGDRMPVSSNRLKASADSTSAHL